MQPDRRENLRITDREQRRQPGARRHARPIHALGIEIVLGDDALTNDTIDAASLPSAAA